MCFYEYQVLKNGSSARAMKAPRKAKPGKGGGGGGGGGGGVLALAAAAPALAAASGALGLGPALAASLLRIPAIMVSIAVPMGTALMSGQAIIMAQVALVIAVIVGLQLALNNNKHDDKEKIVKHLFLEPKQTKEGKRKNVLNSNIVFSDKLNKIYV